MLILGKTKTSPSAAALWAREQGATIEFENLAAYYWELGPKRGGVCPEVAYAQAGKETAFGRFGGVINSSFHNPCGLKTKQGGDNNDPDAHQRFDAWREGVSAHLDHLALYAGAAGYPRVTTHDPRHFASILGRAKTVEGLGGNWAPSKTYGEEITELVHSLLEKEPVKKIIIQKGHHAPREPGHDGATGAQGEQESVGKIGDAVVAALKAVLRFSVRVIPGRIPDDVRNAKNVCHAFISLHCDGSSDPKRDGWGIGFPSHLVNRRFGEILKREFAKFHRSEFIGWNYTPNMSGYYAWNDIDIDGPEVLVEHGFSSNPVERKWMTDNAHRFAKAYHAALLEFFGLSAPPVPAKSYKPPWSVYKGRKKVAEGRFSNPVFIAKFVNELRKSRRLSIGGKEA